MAKDAEQNAKDRLEELNDEIAELARKLEFARKEQIRVKTFLNDYRAFATGLTRQLDLGQHDEKPAKKPTNLDREVIGDAAERLIRAAGRPVSREELFRQVVESGIEIHGKQPIVVFSTMMWRMQHRFVRLPTFGYWLADEPFKPANYVPSP